MAGPRARGPGRVVYSGRVLALVALAYFIGALPLGLLVARRAGVDPRTVGSGNVGATNTYRAAGWKTALAVMTVDLAKGAGAVVVAERLLGSNSVAVCAGVAAVVGHMYPAWLGGRGGKGVATACGVFAVLAPAATAAALVVFVTTVWWTGFVSGGSLAATVTLPVWALAFGEPVAIVAGGVVVAGLVVNRHRDNLRRLRRGTEPRLTRRAGEQRA